MHKEFQRAAEQVEAVLADTERAAANLEALAQFAAQQAEVRRPPTAALLVYVPGIGTYRA